MRLAIRVKIWVVGRPFRTADRDNRIRGGVCGEVHG